MHKVTAFTGGDGKTLINANHSPISYRWCRSVTFLATAADLNETSLEQSLIDIGKFVDERGLKIASQGVKMIIPKELQFTAERLMKSPQRTALQITTSTLLLLWEWYLKVTE